jgi:hypothetical protein
MSPGGAKDRLTILTNETRSPQLGHQVSSRFQNHFRLDRRRIPDIGPGGQFFHEDDPSNDLLDEWDLLANSEAKLCGGSW